MSCAARPYSRRPRALLFVIAVAVLTVASGSPAWASPREVIRDCTDNGRIDRHHRAGDFSGALRQLPSDVDEYTECRRIIEAAARNQRLNRFRAYVRHVRFSRRGRRIHSWLHLPPCRTARPGALRFEFRALRPGRGVAMATARRAPDATATSSRRNRRKHELPKTG